MTSFLLIGRVKQLTDNVLGKGTAISLCAAGARR